MCGNMMKHINFPASKNDTAARITSLPRVSSAILSLKRLMLTWLAFHIVSSISFAVTIICYDCVVQYVVQQAS